MGVGEHAVAAHHDKPEQAIDRINPQRAARQARYVHRQGIIGQLPAQHDGGGALFKALDRRSCRQAVEPNGADAVLPPRLLGQAALFRLDRVKKRERAFAFQPHRAGSGPLA